MQGTGGIVSLLMTANAFLALACAISLFTSAPMLMMADQLSMRDPKGLFLMCMAMLPITLLSLWGAGRALGLNNGRALGWAAIPLGCIAGMAALGLAA